MSKMFLISNRWVTDTIDPCAYAETLDECRQFAERWIKQNDAPGDSNYDDRLGLVFQELPHSGTQTASDDCQLPQELALVIARRGIESPDNPKTEAPTALSNEIRVPDEQYHWVVCV